MTDHRRKEGIPLCQYLMQRVFFEDSDGSLMEGVRKLIIGDGKLSATALSKALAALTSDNDDEGVDHVISLFNFIRVSEGFSWIPASSGDLLHAAVQTVLRGLPDVKVLQSLFQSATDVGGDPEKYLELLCAVSPKLAMSFFKEQKHSFIDTSTSFVELTAGVSLGRLFAFLDAVSQGENGGALLDRLGNGHASPSLEDERLQTLQTLNESLSAKVSELQELVPNLQVENAQLKERLVDLESENTAFHGKDEVLAKKIAVLEAENERIRAEALETAEQQRDAERQKEAESLRVISDLEVKCTEALQNLSSKERLLREESDRCERIEEQTRAMNEKIIQICSERDTLAESVLSLESEARKANVEHDGQITELRKQMLEMEKRCAGLQVNIRQRERAEAMLAETTKELESVRMRNAIPVAPVTPTTVVKTPRVSRVAEKSVKPPASMQAAPPTDDQFSAFFKYMAKHPTPA